MICPKPIPLIYIAGPFTGPTTWAIAQNVREAERWGLEVAKAGGMPVIPHANTHLFHGQLTPDFWYAGTLALLRACAGIVLIHGWRNSRGARDEEAEAHRLGLGVFYADKSARSMTLEDFIDGFRQGTREGGRPDDARNP